MEKSSATGLRYNLSVIIRLVRRSLGFLFVPVAAILRPFVGASISRGMVPFHHAAESGESTWVSSREW